MEQDTLYVLCRSADRRHSLPLDEDEARDIAAVKKAYFASEAESNPLVSEILAGGRIGFAGLADLPENSFLRGPATFFRAHEILRSTRSRNLPVEIGRHSFPHREAVGFLARCVPNLRLQHIPALSPGRYRVSLGIAWSATLLSSHLVARERDSAGMFDPTVLYFLGAASTLAALFYPAVVGNRDVRHPAPWNSALYLDLNADLVRRDSPALAVARKEFLPQQRPFKTSRFYQEVARRIENGGFDRELLGQMRAAQPAIASNSGSVTRFS